MGYWPLIVLIAFMLFQGGCAGKRVEAEPPADGAPAPEAVEKAISPEASVAGLPGDGPWGLDDYEQYRLYLLTHMEEEYPRIGDPKTEDIFFRFVDIPDLDNLPGSPSNMEERFTTLLALTNTVNAVNKAYLGAYLNSGGFPTELCYLADALLKLTGFQVELVEPVVAQFSPSDPLYQVRMDGLAQMKGGVYKVIWGFLTMTSDREGLSLEERRIMALGFKRDGATLLLFVEEDKRLALMGQIEQLVMSEEDGEIRGIFENLLRVGKEASI